MTKKILDLRSRNLKPSDIATIAESLRAYQKNSKNVISSISFSYNPLLGDLGIRALVKYLPYSIREIGLVGCGIGDTGGLELLNWMKNVPNLQMICIENNNFSDDLKINFQMFSDENPQTMVVI